MDAKLESKDNKPVRLQIFGDKLELTSYCVGEGRSRVYLNYSGSIITMAMNADILLDAIKDLDGDITIETCSRFVETPIKINGCILVAPLKYSECGDFGAKEYAQPAEQIGIVDLSGGVIAETIPEVKQVKPVQNSQKKHTVNFSNNDLDWSMIANLTKQLAGG